MRFWKEDPEAECQLAVSKMRAVLMTSSCQCERSWSPGCRSLSASSVGKPPSCQCPWPPAMCSLEGKSLYSSPHLSSGMSFCLRMEYLYKLFANCSWEIYFFLSIVIYSLIYLSVWTGHSITLVQPDTNFYFIAQIVSRFRLAPVLTSHLSSHCRPV